MLPVCPGGEGLRCTRGVRAAAGCWRRENGQGSSQPCPQLLPGARIADYLPPGATGFPAAPPAIGGGAPPPLATPAWIVSLISLFPAGPDARMKKSTAAMTTTRITMPATMGDTAGPPLPILLPPFGALQPPGALCCRMAVRCPDAIDNVADGYWHELMSTSHKLGHPPPRGQ